MRRRAAALVVNQWLLRAVAHYPILGHRLVQLHNLQAFLGVIGLVLVLRRTISAAIVQLRKTAVAQFLFVPPDVRLLMAAVRLVAATAIYWRSACLREEIPVCELLHCYVR
jgi:hypothetical protein